MPKASRDSLHTNPGKKKSKNARKVREIVRGEDAVAAAIADWIERNWNDTDWGGDPVKAIPKGIREGAWRENAAQ